MLVAGVRLVWQNPELLGNAKLPLMPGLLGVREHLQLVDVVWKQLPVITLLGVDVSAGPLIESCLSHSQSW